MLHLQDLKRRLCTCRPQVEWVLLLAVHQGKTRSTSESNQTRQNLSLVTLDLPDFGITHVNSSPHNGNPPGNMGCFRNAGTSGQENDTRIQKLQILGSADLQCFWENRILNISPSSTDGGSRKLCACPIDTTISTFINFDCSSQNAPCRHQPKRNRLSFS